MEKVVVFDSGMPTGAKNRIFERAFAETVSYTLFPLCHLVEEAKQHGITFITPDVFLEHKEQYVSSRVLLMSHLVHPDTEALIAAGVEPFLLTCQESPFIATRFYVFFKRYSSMFRYSMVFPGMRKQISGVTTFMPMFFPEYVTNEKFNRLSFGERRFMVYIASNKETNSITKRIAIKLMYGLSVKLLYPVRRKIIKFLSERNDFDLYGRGWEQESAVYIRNVYRGEVAVVDKIKKLREYKFVLCLENAAFPGYVTEKIFDAFFAGSVPVYLGAPDIADYIPRNAFIDVRDFKDTLQLVAFLDSIDETAFLTYLENIETFLRSEDFTKWSHHRFTRIVIDLIKSA